MKKISLNGISRILSEKALKNVMGGEIQKANNHETFI
jgi:bacteriocin-like protein